MQKKKQQVVITIAVVLVCAVLLALYVKFETDRKNQIEAAVKEKVNNSEFSKTLAALRSEVEEAVYNNILIKEEIAAKNSGHRTDYYRKKLSELVAQETRTDNDILTIQALISLLEDEGYKLYYDESTNTVVG